MFFSASQVLRLMRKAARNGLLAFLPGLLPRMPGIAWKLAARWQERGRERRERKKSKTT
jgi:hypothetical protein